MMNKQIIKKENLKYVWLAVFVTMVCTVYTCQGDNGGSSTIEVKKTEPIQEVIEEKIEEVKVEVEAKVEEVKEVIEEKTEKVIEEKVEELIEEVIPVELPSLPKVEDLPIELPEIAPEDTEEEATE